MRTEQAIREFLASRIAANLSNPTISWYKDRLRYKKGASIVITQKRLVSGEPPGESHDSTLVNVENTSCESSALQADRPSSFPRTPYYHQENEKEKPRRRGGGKSYQDSLFHQPDQEKDIGEI